MRKELKLLIKRLEAQGFTVQQARKTKHLKVYNPQGRLVTTLAFTASEYRGWKNAIATLRRAGAKL